MKKIITLILLTLLTSLVLVSCADLFTPADSDSTGENSGGTNDTNGTNNGNGAGGVGDNTYTEPEVFSPNGDGVIFSPQVDVTVVKGEGIETKDIMCITDKVYNLTSKYAVSKSDANPIDSKEIVVGKTTRLVTKSAKNAYAKEYNATVEQLKMKGEEYRYLCGFIIYSDGDAVAIYWDDDIIKYDTIEYFVNNYVQKSSLCLQKGFFDVQFFDKEKLEKEAADAKREAQFDAIAEMYGEEAAEAVREHLEMFDERYYMWLADLYDPGEYDAYGNPLGGGFYYSNSARDTTGYGVDIESTAQAIGFLASSGLLGASSEVKDKFPVKMQREIVAFALSCQSSVDGYFYHPQWGDNVQISRISRDLGNAVNILKLFGEIPYWDTPSGVKGSLGAPGAVAPVSALTSPVGNDTVAAVSLVVSASSPSKWTGSSQLATVSAWETYLLDLTKNIRTNSYSIGNTVTSQSSQVVNRDKLAIANGELPDADENGIADGGYIETFERIFNSLQLENGLWEECSVEDGTVYYNAINGIMKISSAYNGIGVKLNYAEEGLRAAAFMVTYIGESDDGSDWADSKGKKPNGSVDVYNPWVTINAILKNVSNFYTKEEAEALRENIIKPNALEMIKVTTRKIKMFAKADGSYGYTWTTSPSHSQGAPAAVPGTVEGDVNGGGIAFTGTFSNMANALGFSGLKPFNETDFLAFIDRASSRTHIKKEARASFDGDDVGTAVPSEVTLSKENSATVVDDPREGNLGNVLSFTTVRNSGNSVNIAKPDNNTKKSGIALEWDMAFTEINNGGGVSFQIKLGSCYMFVISVDTSGKLTISDSSSTNGSIAVTNRISAAFNAMEWNSFRIEYYVLDAGKKSTSAKVYVNGELVFVSNTYVGKESSKTPILTYENASFYALNSTDFTVQFDNIRAYDLIKKYKEETPKYTK